MAVKTLEERVTLVEHKVAENARGIDGLRGAIADLGARMDRRFDAIDRRFDANDQRFDGMDRRFDAMRQQHASDFRWLAGFQIMTLIAIVGVLATAVLGR